nr:glycoside hydrolase family 76 protein [uncultured Bacteroides sp.]
MGRKYFLLYLILLSFCSCATKYKSLNVNYHRATQTLDSIYKYYSVNNSSLLRETYPFQDTYKATYLASEPTSSVNQFSYLWPYSGVFSAVNTIYEVSGNKFYKEMLDNKVLPGLENYFDSLRKPFAYSSYVNTVSPSDRFYDDNIWLGIDFTNLYLLTKNKEYLKKANLIWNFIESGTDSVLGGGIYWCEQKKESKNTCSNAPGAVFALKLYQATGEKSFLDKGTRLYEWTKRNLQDKSDELYYDNINLSGHIGKAKYPYNSGQMLQAASLLYKLSKNKDYLDDAQKLATASSNYFFSKRGNINYLKDENDWFIAVMLRGFYELYTIDHNPKYLKDYQESLDFLWKNGRTEKGLFDDNQFNAPFKEKKTKWLLTQAALVEIYARLSNFKQ